MATDFWVIKWSKERNLWHKTKPQKCNTHMDVSI